MRNMLALFAAALLTVVGVGWYLSWYKVRSQPASVPGQHSVNIDINTKKITKDLHEGEQKFQQMWEKGSGEEAKKAADGLILPSPAKNTAKTPLFQFHRDTSNGPSSQLGGAIQHPLLKLGGETK